MKEDTIYCVVVEFDDGGQQMNSFLKKESALKESFMVVDDIINNDRKGIKVFLSELPYDKHNNLLLTNKLVNSESVLLLNN